MYALLQFTLVIRYCILLVNSLRRKSVEVRFGLIEQNGRFVRILRGFEALDHCAHFASVDTVSFVTLGVLTYSFYR